MSNCFEFREHLEQMLCGSPNPGKLVPLSWDEHLLGCQVCRELLHAEQALELVLASLPEPQLPPELTSRVIARMRRERERCALDKFDLDAALDDAPEPIAPAGLSEQVLQGVHSAREEQRQSARQTASQLDALLDLCPTPLAPTGLATRVLDALDDERHLVPTADGPSSGFKLLSSAKVMIPLAAALLVGILWFTRSIWRLSGDSNDLELAQKQPISTIELNDEMIDAFEILDNWDHLNGEDVDLLLSSIDELDELLFETSEWDVTDSDEEQTDEDSEG